MSDEEHVDPLDPDRVLVMWGFGRGQEIAEALGERPNEQYVAAGRYFDHMVVAGDKLPELEVEYHRCDQGCHLQMWVADSANGLDYYETQVPTVLFPEEARDGIRAHPVQEAAMVSKRQSVLN